ncbi:MAG: hypothetical protein R3D60_13065 [Paracoccaceae bacterium]
MGAMKPVLGYRSMSAAVLALSGAGLSVAEITKRINAAQPDRPVTAQKVSRVKHVARHRAGPTKITLRLSKNAAFALAKAARARGEQQRELAERLLEAVMADGLINAILDDGGDA